MRILIDPHCHIYANYDLRKSLYFAEQRDADAIAVFLTERFDCNYFDQLASESTQNNHLETKIIDQNCLRINQKLFIFRGRQFATSEGLEVLSLFVSPKLEEKLEARIYCEQIISEGGLIAFSWAFGKLLGSRGKIVSQLARQYGRSNVLLLDSRLRPAFLKLPRFFEELRKNSFNILAGSDPLPLSSQHDKLASFGNLYDAPDLEVDKINSSFMKNLLVSHQFDIQHGNRTGFVQFLSDQLMLRI